MTEINDLISKIVNNVQEEQANSSSNTTASSQSTTATAGKTMTAADYPFFQKHPDLVNAPTGKNVKEVTLEAAINGQVKPEDLRISPATLKAQGQIAASAGRPSIQSNFDRAAELTKIPDERVLEMYSSLRPYRSSEQELLDMADELENKYGAKICANFVREAATEYKKRKKLKGDN
ncbi:diol dehydratase small subunit [Companilactobacillus sp.]|jgi:propanediol dehydratase small subunit|uniref:diol dehydratase small subunit n=1 Tax=Companilactobacillus sp. TaxID=2767905 RepID=UPI0025C60144|nr:diol dehydratase small subunit [Companilactobacillus sp.]MCH4008652.1 diol dehydratase small subunit [Companilactobacillus sp.]MCH4051169.1 diol dehydratase small subunit [Companilactobacillus sp.]MCH4076595.1 diol dehydratase small subunit [Companilactobacillus sp.]MCH4125170.1 diol dehydratase small subunit [Companilactobacillus sp.]MCH4131710.1 diol dehydratase small subunit [Companilactobacillus sp.]